MMTTTLPDRPWTEDRSSIGRRVANPLTDQSAPTSYRDYGHYLILSPGPVEKMLNASAQKGGSANASNYDGV